MGYRASEFWEGQLYVGTGVVSCMWEIGVVGLYVG